MILDAEFSEEVKHDLLGTILKGTISTEYYWLDRWYNIFRFGPGGSGDTFYCNVTIPPSFDGNTLSYIDLDIDVFVKSDLSFDVLDLDDFERNAKRYGYSVETYENAQLALKELIRLIQTRSFPFN